MSHLQREANSGDHITYMHQDGHFICIQGQEKNQYDTLQPVPEGNQLLPEGSNREIAVRKQVVEVHYVLVGSYWDADTPAFKICLLQNITQGEYYPNPTRHANHKIV